MYPARHVDVLCRVHGVRHRRMFGWSEYYRHLYTVRRSGVLTVVQAPSSTSDWRASTKQLLLGRVDMSTPPAM
jgi:hypothetical protein